MGRSPKPLSILVHPALWETPELKALAEKGHVLILMCEGPSGDRPFMGSADKFDLVIGPNCWRMDDVLIKYLDLAIKAAWGVRYPKRVKK